MDEIHHLDFSPFERSAYDQAKQSTVKMLEDAISSGNQGQTTFNALQRLNVLRLICSHGVLAQASRKRMNEPLAITSEPQTPTPQNLLGDLDEPNSCPNCGMNILEDLLESSSSTGLDMCATEVHGLQILCTKCNAQTPYNGIISISTNGDQVLQSCESASDSASPMPMNCDSTQSTLDSMSTKIKALVEDLSMAHRKRG